MRIFFILAILLSSNAQAETFKVNLLNEEWTVKGTLDSKHEFRLLNITLESNTGESYGIINAMGWGTRPMNSLCDQLTDGKLKFASQLGQLEEPNLFSPAYYLEFGGTLGTFGELSELKVIHKQNLPNNLYAQNLICLDFNDSTGE